MGWVTEVCPARASSESAKAEEVMPFGSRRLRAAWP